MNAQRIIELEDRHGSGAYAPRLPVIVRGKGARLWDIEGREYIDCMSGHGVANLGHAHPTMIRALSEQVEKLWTCPNGFYNDQRALLLAELARITPEGLDRAFLCNSGAEAVEAAIKFARVATGRTRIVSAMRAYHGRTMGALSATWNKAYREPFAPLVPEFAFVPYDRLEPMEAAIDDSTAAVILEIVQGEGGVHPGSTEYLRGVQDLCRDRGALLIIDEVQTGFGRTGAMFACEHHDLRPDLLCMAKAIAGGVPMGATLIGPRVGEIPRRVHSTTFGGNPLACAAALASIGVIEQEGLVERAAKLGTRFRVGLESIRSPLIREVRGLGLMLAVELKSKSLPFLRALSDRGVLALPAGSTVLRFLPPLVITEAEVDTTLTHVSEVLTTKEAARG